MAEFFVILLTLSSFISITLFEALIVLGLFSLIIVYWRRKEFPKGVLFPPLLLHALPVLLSTALYAPHLLGKGIERSVFLLLYLGGSEIKIRERFLYRLNLLLVSIGFLLIPVVLYNYKEKGVAAPLWGGIFEVAVFYSLFSLSALALFLKSKRILWLIALLLFLSITFFTLRRSTILGLVLSLFILLFIIRKHVKLKYVSVIILFSLFAGILFSYNFVQKDARFQILYKVLIGEAKLDEQALNTISSSRLANLKAALWIIEKDIKEGNIVPLLIGHGIKPEERLEVKWGIGFESLFIVSEFIEKGFLGLLSILWLYWRYYSFVLKYKVKDFLVIPLLLMPSVMFIGSIFTFFWDALLPLYLLWFRMIEGYKEGKN